MADDDTRNYDGIWRPERDLNQRWIATRYVLVLDLNQSRQRERDVEYIRGYEVPRYFDVIGPCEARCDELNNAGQ